MFDRPFCSSFAANVYPLFSSRSRLCDPGNVFADITNSLGFVDQSDYRRLRCLQKILKIGD